MKADDTRYIIKRYNFFTDQIEVYPFNNSLDALKFYKDCKTTEYERKVLIKVTKTVDGSYRQIVRKG